MKKSIYFLPILILALACTPKVKPVVDVAPVVPAEPKLLTFKDSVSYFLGFANAEQLEQAIPEEAKKDMFDKKVYLRGLKEGFEGKDRLINEEEGQKMMVVFQERMQALTKAEAERKAKEAKAKGTTFLAQNAQNEGVQTTASGLQYKVLQEGTGAMPTAADKVEVHYAGRLINGEEFDSSYKRGSTTTFGVGQVIKGWTEGLQLMKEGAKYQFYIPADLAYGNRGSGAKIGPGEVLIFDVELVKVIK